MTSACVVGTVAIPWLMSRYRPTVVNGGVWSAGVGGSLPRSSDSVATASSLGTLFLGTCFSCQRLCGVCTATPTPRNPRANHTHRSALHSAQGSGGVNSGGNGGGNHGNGSSSAAAPPAGSLVELQRSTGQNSNRTYRSYLPAGVRTYSCVHCRAHLADHQHLISKSFQGSQGCVRGRAYLFESVVNVGCGPAEERVLLTGLHAVADIYCVNCKTTLGWKYEHAFEMTQKYKEGKYIIELAHMLKENYWD
ncbi:uncharacterized protein LOC121302120 [Polyodon spathula]|uniref:uncharacterized protein LOC121302120 n=1 Tax=Polyodon spathula TaxID=7913 RepID=UPI001B7E1919|nr:uncharacterized protein LOC121302120 [Polyodon spathula]